MGRYMSGVGRTACALVAIAGLMQGCLLSQSVSKSVRTASKSISNSLTLTQDPFGASADERESMELQYRDDVRVAAHDLVSAGAASADFQRELGRIAALHGISHWEGEPGTLLAIGAGACQAGASGPELDELLVELGQRAPRDRELAQKGCRSAAL